MDMYEYTRQSVPRQGRGVASVLGIVYTRLSRHLA